MFIKRAVETRKQLKKAEKVIDEVSIMFTPLSHEERMIHRQRVKKRAEQYRDKYPKD